MDIGIAGIRCDADGCGYEDNFGSWGQTPEEILAMNEEYLNKPCPTCGANLLTEEDAATVRLIVGLIAPLTVIEEALGDAGGPKAKVRLEMDGSGNIDVGDINLIEE